MTCSSTAVLGTDSRAFYVSDSAVYLWVTGEMGYEIKDTRAMLYRLPLNGAAPQAVSTRGAPVDQFAFHEDARARRLYVLVRSESAGDKMWRPEFSEGAVALARVGFDSFGDGSGEVAKSDYRFLPSPGREEYDFHERFVGNYVLYGNGNGWGNPKGQSGTLTVVRLSGGEPTQLSLSAPIDRIEPLGGDALVVGGNARSLDFITIELSGANPRLGSVYKLPQASQSETRSHAFFYQPDEDSADGASGILGLPIARPGTAAYRQLFQNSMAITFLRRSHRVFSPLGEMASSTRGLRDDRCVASCVDWYGNARPIFLGHRIFALLGYELVEGQVSGGSIEERGRVNYAPERQARPAEEPLPDTKSSWDD
jgi:hypothetical protein